jgi:glycosyltransferase involved in cell wall biosynthesis
MPLAKSKPHLTLVPADAMAAQPLKVALIDPSLFTLPYDAKLATALRAIGHSVRFYGKALAPDETAAGIDDLQQIFYPELVRWDVARWPGSLAKLAKGALHGRSMARLLTALRRDPPDVIHFQWLPLPIIDRAFIGRLRRIAPLVLTAHDSRPFNANPGSILQTFGATSILTRFDRVIVHTEQGRQRLADYGVPADRLAKVAHGFLHDDDVAPPQPPVDRGDGTVRFLLFGKIKPYKGVDLVIEAVRRMPAEDRARCRVDVVGKPYMDVAPLVSAAADLGDRMTFDFRFVEDRDLMSLLARADALVFPYREIDMSGVLMTGLRGARPIIASGIGGFAELLEDGRHGFLVPPGDPDALSAAMSRLIREPATRQHFSREIGALVSTIPSWREIALRTSTVYLGARGNSPDPRHEIRNIAPSP